ncbi:MAG: ketopantoate reductase family protein [Desulfurococcaceae archaeon]
MDSTRQVCIIGGGAVGSVLAYFLHRSGVSTIPVYYASRESVLEVERQGGVVAVDRRAGSEYLVPVEPRHYSEPRERCVFVLNAVKALDVPRSLELAARLVLENSVLVMLQNGFGSLEQAEERFPGLKVAGGVVYFAAERVGRARVVYHGGDSVVVGCRRSACEELRVLEDIFRRGGLDFRVVDNIDHYRWIKLAVNAVINPLTAITRSRNSIVLEEEGVRLAELIVREVCEAARLHGYELDTARLLKHVLRVVEASRDNYSSMAQDIAAGRATEVDYINGFIARELGEKSTVNTVLTLLVKLLEKASKRRKLRSESVEGEKAGSMY